MGFLADVKRIALLFNAECGNRRVADESGIQMDGKSNLIASNPLRDIAIPVAIVFAASAALSFAQTAPAEWIFAGLGIFLVYVFGDLLPKLGWRPHPHGPITNPHSSFLSAADQHAAHIRRTAKSLLVVLLVMTMWDYGFTRYALRLVGPEMETNPLARYFLVASPTGLFCYKFGWVSFCIALMSRFYETWLARFSLWALVGTFSVLIMYWGVWFASFLSNIPTGDWMYAAF